MKLNTVDFSDDFYKGKIVNVNVNGHYFGKIEPFIEPFSDKIVLRSLDDDGNDVMIDYDDINTLIDDLETMELERLG